MDMSSNNGVLKMRHVSFLESHESDICHLINSTFFNRKKICLTKIMDMNALVIKLKGKIFWWISRHNKTPEMDFDTGGEKEKWKLMIIV